MSKAQILRVCAKEILDSRGEPTVESTVILTDGTVGVAAVPSGKSTGKGEAPELRDMDSKRYFGKGVLVAVSNVNDIISPALSGVCVTDQSEIDRILCDIDRSGKKSRLGSNAVLSVSLASARAAANRYSLPLYRYLGGACRKHLPTPMMCMIEGGLHAPDNIDIQEMMIVPHGFKSFSESLRAGCEIYHALKNILVENGYCSSVGDEGGFAPDLDRDEDGLELIKRAIKAAGYSEENVGIALDIAASVWYDSTSGEYVTPKRGNAFTKESLISYYSDLVSRYPIISIEDGMDENDKDGWIALSSTFEKRIMTVGDDLFTTDPLKLKRGIQLNEANSVIIKPNQIGTLSEVFEFADIAKNAGYKTVTSHRSGETEDTTISDIAVALSSDYIKAGAPTRTERVAKYNRLLRIEGSLGAGRFGN